MYTFPQYETLFAFRWFIHWVYFQSEIHDCLIWDWKAFVLRFSLTSPIVQFLQIVTSSTINDDEKNKWKGFIPPWVDRDDTVYDKNKRWSENRCAGNIHWTRRLFAMMMDAGLKTKDSASLILRLHKNKNNGCCFFAFWIWHVDLLLYFHALRFCLRLI